MDSHELRTNAPTPFSCRLASKRTVRRRSHRRSHDRSWAGDVPPPDMTRVRILIADDHEILRNGMRVLLEREPGWVVCGQATTGNDVVAMAIELKPDVILLDISMPGMNGLQAARQIRRSVPSPIVFVSLHDTPDFEREAINAGASGFVST